MEITDGCRYSDINVKDTSLREALKSGLFEKLRNNGMLNESHDGGCVLFSRKNEVIKILNGSEPDEK